MQAFSPQTVLWEAEVPIHCAQTPFTGRVTTQHPLKLLVTQPGTPVKLVNKQLEKGRLSAAGEVGSFPPAEAGLRAMNWRLCFPEKERASGKKSSESEINRRERANEGMDMV